MSATATSLAAAAGAATASATTGTLHALAANTLPHEASSRRRPFWSLWGGVGITTGGALLLAATLLEPTLRAGSSPGLLGVFSVLFLGSAVIHGVAMVAVSGGRTGSDGAVGTLIVGRISLLGFGAVFLTLQTLYFTLTYALPAMDDTSSTFALSSVLGVAQSALLLTGSIVIVRAGIASGAARWALLVMTVIALITGVIANTTDSFDVTIAALSCSTVAQVVVGLVLALSRGPRR